MLRIIIFLVVFWVIGNIIIPILNSEEVKFITHWWPPLFWTQEWWDKMITVFPSEASGWIGNVFAWIFIIFSFIIALIVLIAIPYIIKYLPSFFIKLSRFLFFRLPITILSNIEDCSIYFNEWIKKWISVILIILAFDFIAVPILISQKIEFFSIWWPPQIWKKTWWETIIAPFPNTAGGIGGNIGIWIITLINLWLALVALIALPVAIKRLIRLIFRKYWDYQVYQFLDRIWRNNQDIVNRRKKFFDNIEDYQLWFYNQVISDPEIRKWENKIRDINTNETSDRYQKFISEKLNNF
ncbi:hypothetical protein MCAV_05490 [[Mycoplasma] cavipharyngis]|uniref:hypothetical protein n=1 Tax=[Mycoplasma] cavipharyngis TaxID=92757 RepID=UPI003703AE40